MADHFQGCGQAVRLCIGNLGKPRLVSEITSFPLQSEIGRAFSETCQAQTACQVMASVCQIMQRKTKLNENHHMEDEDFIRIGCS